MNMCVVDQCHVWAWLNDGSLQLYIFFNVCINFANTLLHVIDGFF